MSDQKSMELNDEQLAAAARIALENPAFLLAVNNLKEDYTAAWRQSRPEDKEGRETAYYRLKALDAVVVELNNILQAPKVNAHNRALRSAKR